MRTFATQHAVAAWALGLGAWIFSVAPLAQAQPAQDEAAAPAAEATATAEAPEAEAPEAEAPEAEATTAAAAPATPSQTRSAELRAREVEALDGTHDSESIPARQRVRDPELSRPSVAARKLPARLVFSLGGGFSVRLVQNLQFQQSRLAPAFVELSAGVVLPQLRDNSGRLRHHLSLRLATNVMSDGSYTLGVDPLEQWVITPSYALRVSLGDRDVPDAHLSLRVGIPLALSPDFSWGGELGLGADYMILAGFGLYAEASSSVFFGAKSREGHLTAHPIFSVQLGLVIDVEIL